MAAPRIHTWDGVRSVPAAEWDACVQADDPFTEHAFLSLLEEAGCVGPGTGWVPTPLTLHRGERVEGVVPLYRKTDSYGEYLFDWAWARGAQEAGLRYYPKLTAAVPFTPAGAGRLLFHPEAPVEPTRRALAAGARLLALQHQASSLHWLFCTQEEARGLEGHLVRRAHQLTWVDQGWADFEAFLADMSHKRRKEIRRERRKAASHGLDLRILVGDQLEERHWQEMGELYLLTHRDRPWQRPYLTPAWWRLAPERMGQGAVMALALDGEEVVAGSLSFRKGRHLYGRYWGARVPLDSMHFELCYHRLVEYALQQGLTRVEAGAQGGHKLHRGFLPEPVWSAHWFRDARLSRAVDRYLAVEGAEVEAERDWLIEHGPFK